MASRLGNTIPFKQFMLRSEVLKLYRDIMRAIRQVSDADHRRELTEWVRHDFKQNKHHQDEETIKMMLMKGRMSLKELESAIHLAR
ncbi:LYR motif-containing protein 2-like [Haliotis rubra]|uniref:LYR motif-containing protein 2-like n=1 Tax=Haliotis rubra TaxID=36100 RepID=UPI001EE62CCB|nr:LYR motif-containing protein 2-like [Haliotis rubra]